MNQIINRIRQIPNSIQHTLFILIIISISATLSIWEVSINEHQSEINITGTLSAIGTFIIAYFTFRVTTTLQNKASEQQFNKVVGLIEELRKIILIIEKQDNLSIFDIYESNEIDNIKVVKVSAKDEGKTIDFDRLYNYNLDIYKSDPILPKNIRKSVENIHKVVLENRTNQRQKYIDYKPLLEIVKEINKWFRENRLEDYTLDNINRQS